MEDRVVAVQRVPTKNINGLTIVRLIPLSIEIALFVVLGLALLCQPAGAGDAKENGKIIRNKLWLDDEINALCKEGKFVEAAQLAKERYFSPKVIGYLYFQAGEKEEAMKSFAQYAQVIQEDYETGLAVGFMDLLDLADSLEKDLHLCTYDEYFEYLAEHGIYTRGEDQMRCDNIYHFAKKGKKEEALALANQMLDSSFDGEELILPVFFLAGSIVDSARPNDPDWNKNRDIAWQLTEKLRAKYPRHPIVLLRWIGRAISDELDPLVDPQIVLVELEKLYEEAPDFCQKNEEMIRYTRGKALELMGEWERAKAEFLQLKDNPMAQEQAARCDSMIREIQTYGHRHGEVSTPEIPEERETWSFPTRLVIFIVGNTLLLSTAFILWRRKKSE